MGVSKFSPGTRTSFRWTPIAGPQIAALSQAGLMEINLQILSEVQSSHVPGWGLRTGQLRDSYEDTVSGALSRKIVNPTPYAGFVEFGTRQMPAQQHLRLASQRVASRYSNVHFFFTNGRA